MVKQEAAEYRAKIGNDFGNIRGKIPAPIVRMLGARAGDYIVFKVDTLGNVTANVRRESKKGGKVVKKKR